ncbi:MAG: CDGSH iron-sulfur domain-containing protein [Solirubrobacterales bacterium]|jgi:CDGSH-type Zn-finger protein
MDEERTVEIHVRPNGSLKVYGAVRILDVDGDPYDLEAWRKQDKHGERIKLCRCGQTKTPPFCDESHVETGFASEPRTGDGYRPA